MLALLETVPADVVLEDRIAAVQANLIVGKHASLFLRPLPCPPDAGTAKGNLLLRNGTKLDVLSVLGFLYEAVLGVLTGEVVAVYIIDDGGGRAGGRRSDGVAGAVSSGVVLLKGENLTTTTTTTAGERCGGGDARVATTNAGTFGLGEGGGRGIRIDIGRQDVVDAVVVGFHIELIRRRGGKERKGS